MRFLDDIDGIAAAGAEDTIVSGGTGSFDESYFSIIDKDALSVDEFCYDAKYPKNSDMINEKRPWMPFFLAPFRGHKGFGLLHMI